MDEIPRDLTDKMQRMGVNITLFKDILLKSNLTPEEQTIVNAIIKLRNKFTALYQIEMTELYGFFVTSSIGIITNIFVVATFISSWRF